MVQVNDALLDAVRTRVDSLTLLATSPLQTMEAEKIAIFGLYNMLLCLMGPKLTQLNKIGSVTNRIRDAFDRSVLCRLQSRRQRLTFDLAMYTLVFGG